MPHADRDGEADGAGATPGPAAGGEKVREARILRDVLEKSACLTPGASGGVAPRRPRRSPPKLGVDADGEGRCAQTPSLVIAIPIGYRLLSLPMRLHFLSESRRKLVRPLGPHDTWGGGEEGPTARCGGRVAEECPRPISWLIGWKSDGRRRQQQDDGLPRSWTRR